jgi:hypothetical protein
LNASRVAGDNDQRPNQPGSASSKTVCVPFVSIDGTAYRATADCPADEIHGNEPSVALAFVPGLPFLQ